MSVKAKITSILTVLLLLSPLGYAGAQDNATVDDKDITVLHFEDLPYPTFARAAHIEGVVVLQVTLDDKGGVARAVAISGNKALTGECIANIRKRRFQPNAKKSVVIVYDFTLKTASCGSGSQPLHVSRAQHRRHCGLCRTGRTDAIEMDCRVADGQAFQVAGTDGFDFAGGASLRLLKGAGLDVASREPFMQPIAYSTEASGFRAHPPINS